MHPLKIRMGFIGFIGLVFNTHAYALKVTMTPYIQSVTSRSAVIRWETDDQVDSRVSFGTSLNDLNKKVTFSRKEKGHEITLSNLEVGSKYFYSIGTQSKTLLEPSVDRYFVTYNDDQENLQVWVLGDPGTGEQIQKEVRDSYLKYSKDLPPHLILTDGDNAYDRGTESQFKNQFFAVYRDIFQHVAVWPAKGNHDEDEKVYSNLFVLPTQGEAGGVPSKSELYYSFNAGSAHFISINSDQDTVTGTDPMSQWLKADLAANRKQWTIAYFHHAPYSRGSHDSDGDRKMTAMRKSILPILEKGGVDLVLSGHSHSYERSVMLNGHYGPANTFAKSMVVDGTDGKPSAPYSKSASGPVANSGAVYQLIGTSGHDEAEGKLNHPTTISRSYESGSVVLSISKERLQSVFLTAKGTLLDQFAMVKPLPSGN